MATKAKETNRLAQVNGKKDDDDNGGKKVALTITPPKLEVLHLKIIGTAPLVINRFGQKAINQMREVQEAGSVAKKGKKREPKDFAACFQDARHISNEGWDGFPASAFRAASISACRLAGFKMTLAKLAIFVEADGFDVVDGIPLVRITKGEPKHVEHAVRNATGVADIRARPMWAEGWEMVLRIKYDAEVFSTQDVANLMDKVGQQVGIGEGRPGSKNSCGMGWGTFKISLDVN